MIKINSHPLPKLLESAIDTGHWKIPEDTTRLRNVTGIDNIGILNFLNPKEMEIETAAISNLCLDDPENVMNVYSMVNDKDANVDRDWKIAVEEIVVIAASFGDDVICLNYKNADDCPEVYVTDWSGAKCQWKKISNSFEEFYASIGEKRKSMRSD